MSLRANTLLTADEREGRGRTDDHEVALARLNVGSDRATSRPACRAWGGWARQNAPFGIPRPKEVTTWSGSCA